MGNTVRMRKIVSPATCANEGAFGSFARADHLPGALGRDEEAPMADRLDGQKHAVEENREQGEEEALHLR